MVTAARQLPRWPLFLIASPAAVAIWSGWVGLAGCAARSTRPSAPSSFVDAVNHQDCPPIEALIADVAMVVCSLLALGMACAGQPAKAARLLVVVFAGLSAGMNYRRPTCPRSARCGVRDAAGGVRGVHHQTVAVIRRHGLGIAEDSAWTVLGRLVLAVVRLAGIILLYSLRFTLAPAETAKGLRRVVLNAAPFPEAGQDHRPRGGPRGRSRPEAAPGPFPR